MAEDDIQRIIKKQIDFSKVYTSLSLFRSGPLLHDGGADYNAKFELDFNAKPLFPYLNTVAEGALLYTKPDYIKFMHEDHLCILYPNEGAFTSVDNHADAVEFLGKILEFIQNIAQHSKEIKPNYRQSKSISALDIFKLLPGTNCQDCGFKTCLAFAASLSRQKTSLNKCPHLPPPVEEQYTFSVLDKGGKEVQTVSLPIDTNGLYEEIEERNVRIQKLQDRLAEFEMSRASIEVNNARLISPLTPRELEVLKMVASGATNKEVSKNMKISDHTVKTHIVHIFDKLRVNDRSQASVWAAKNGLI